MMLLLSAILTLSQPAPSPLPTVDASSGTGESQSKIIMYRGGSILGGLGACPIRYKGAEIVDLGRNQFAEWAVPAGRYILTNKGSSLEVSVFAGETRYVRCKIENSSFTAKADLQIVDQESYEENAHKYERREIAASASQIGQR